MIPDFRQNVACFSALLLFFGAPACLLAYTRDPRVVFVYLFGYLVYAAIQRLVAEGGRHPYVPTGIDGDGPCFYCNKLPRNHP